MLTQLRKPRLKERAPLARDGIASHLWSREWWVVSGSDGRDGAMRAWAWDGLAAIYLLQVHDDILVLAPPSLLPAGNKAFGLPLLLHATMTDRYERVLVRILEAAPFLYRLLVLGRLLKDSGGGGRGGGGGGGAGG